MITAINVYPDLFGPPLTLGNLRAGDLIAACNFLEYLRLDEGANYKDLRMYIPDESLFPADHVFQMRSFLLENTDYLTMFPDQLVELKVVPGTDATYPSMYNLWNIRQDVLIRRQNVFDIPDAVKILNGWPTQKKKIVIAPLIDASYNESRNWSKEYFQNIILNYYCWLTGYEIIIASKEPLPFEIGHAKYCYNYKETLQHILQCEIFIGGDSGLSHFASVLEPGPICEFHYPKDTYGTTCPFYWKTKHKIIYY